MESGLASATCPGDATTPFGVSAVGGFRKIYDPSLGEATKWYINDHTIVKDGKTNLWHLFGITHEEPADPENEHVFAHAVSAHLYGPWVKQPYALHVDASYGETHLWAPYVLNVNGTWHMFYNGGGQDLTSTEINLATSHDLYHWKRNHNGPLFRDGFESRDPFVIRIGDDWVIYYCGTSDPKGGNHVVLYRTSKDLVNWSERQIAFTDPTIGTGGGTTESPYVVQHEGQWFLFLGPRPSQEAYVGTDVFISSDPFHFDIKDRVGHINSHALEVVKDGDRDFVTHCGWGQGGVYIAPLNWPAANQIERCPVT